MIEFTVDDNIENKFYNLTDKNTQKRLSYIVSNIFLMKKKDMYASVLQQDMIIKKETPLWKNISSQLKILEIKFDEKDFDFRFILTKNEQN
jgi:hypothetical protein